MAELRLEHILGFVIALGILVVVGLGGMLIYVLLPQIIAFSRAFWARNFNADWWANTLEWIADRREGVSDYEGAQERQAEHRPAPAHMSSQQPAPRQRIGAVPGTDTKGTVPGGTAPIDLTYDEAVRTAAAIKVNGKWWMSGKKLYSVVGGNHARFLEIVSEVRGDVAADDVPTPSNRSERPANGWGNAT